MTLSCFNCTSARCWIQSIHFSWFWCAMDKNAVYIYICWFRKSQLFRHGWVNICWPIEIYYIAFSSRKLSKFPLSHLTQARNEYSCYHLSSVYRSWVSKYMYVCIYDMMFIMKFITRISTFSNQILVTNWYQNTHYNDIIIGAIASQITSLTIVYWTVYSDADQREHQAPRHWPLWGIHRWPVNSSNKWPVTQKRFPFDDVIMVPLCILGNMVNFVVLNR